MESSEETLFEAAMKLGNPRQRTAFLDASCQGQPDLRRRLEDLLAAQPEADAFFQKRLQPECATAAMPVTEKAGDRIGRYKLLQQIGEGGCGVVYMAEQEEPVRRRVALKVIKLGMDTKQVIGRFEAERQALALMDHPNIARVFDAGATETGRPFFVMELVRGTKITDYCDQNNLTTRERLDLFIQICHAVQHAHQKGIIHRDIKPSNILVTVNDGMRVPKVIDFGIAKATGRQQLTDKTLFTAFEQFIGTPAYMSPEQAEMTSLDIDTRSDIYALGVLLYELLTGRTPFDPKTLLATGLDEMRRTIRDKEPVRPSTRLQTMLQEERTTAAHHRRTEAPKLIHLLRGDLDWIVMKCLEKDRARRYETGNALAQDLERHLQHEPVAARPPSTVYRIQKFVRRNKMMATAGAAVVAALVLGLVVSTWLASRAKNAEHRAEAQASLARQAETTARQESRKAEAERVRASMAALAEKQQREQAERTLYAANMNLAQQAWEQNNVGRLRQLLAETAAYPQRGFEWYYWQRCAHLELKTLSGHKGEIIKLAISPDGRRIATGSTDTTAKVWDAASGKELLTLKGHSAPVSWVRFSPEGQRLITASYDHTARLWDAVSGQALLTLKGHLNAIIAAAFSPDGRRIATAGRDRTPKVWDAASGKELLTLKGHSALTGSVGFSPDGRRIVTGGDDQVAKVWDAASGQELLTLRGNDGFVGYAVFSPDGKRILTISRNTTATVWDAATGDELFRLEGHTDSINFAAFSPDSRRIITSSVDQTYRVWDAATGKGLSTHRGHAARSATVEFSPDSRWIVTSDAGQTAKVWDAAGERGLLTLVGHSNEMLCVTFSSDGRRIATGSADWTAKLWDAASGQELLSLPAHDYWVDSVAFSPDGQRLATVSRRDPIARVWEVLSRRPLLILKGHANGIVSIAFSPDGHRMVTGSYDRTAKVWDAAAGKNLTTLVGHSEVITSAVFSPDSQRIVTGSWDMTAKLWDAAGGTNLSTLLGHSDGITSVAFSPDGQTVVTASYDRTARVWDAIRGSHLVTLIGHSREVTSVAFSPDGRRIVTGSLDKTARVWDAAAAKELLTLKEPDAGISTLAFAPDGQRIVAGNWDRAARIWQAASEAQVARWRQEEQAAAESLVVQERERAVGAARDAALRVQDPGAIKQWLVLLPIPYEGREGSRALLDEQLAPECQLRPHAGQRVKVGEVELVWRAVQEHDYHLDFNALAGALTGWHVAYAVAYIRSEADQSDVVLKVGSDDQCNVYLNGRLVHRSLAFRHYIADEDVARGLDLKAGVNVLVFKVVNEVAGWEGSVRLTDPDGNPLKGIRVELDPYAKN